MIYYSVILILVCILIQSSSSLLTESSSTESSSSLALDYDSLTDMINNMSDENKEKLLQTVVKMIIDSKRDNDNTSDVDNSTSIESDSSTSSRNIDHDNRSVMRLLKSSKSIQVKGFCDDTLNIFINGTLKASSSFSDMYPVKFNPLRDTLSIQGIDFGSNYGCVLYFNDIPLTVNNVNNHFKCTYFDQIDIEIPSSWHKKAFNDSTWGGVSPIEAWFGEGFWAEGLDHPNGQFFCRYHHEPQCPKGSESYNKNCWCSIGYKSANGLAPCEPCDDNALTTSIGSTMCTCAASAFSVNGFDSPNSCESCPYGSYTTTTGTLATSASEVCQCGVPSQSSNTWSYDGLSYNASTIPIDMFRSDTGFAPCNLCPDSNTLPYHLVDDCMSPTVQHTGASSCYCKVGYRSTDGFSPCLECTPGSSTLTKKGLCFNNYFKTIYLTGSSTCFCSQGYFSSSGTDNDGPCQQCPTGTSTLEVSGGTSCSHCDIGWFSVNGLSASGCQQCPNGETTSAIGTATKCDLCDVDYYSPSGKGPCVRCASGYGTFGLKGQTSCQRLKVPTQSPTRKPTNKPPTRNPTSPSPYPTPKPTSPSPRPTIKPTQPRRCDNGFYSSTGLEPCSRCPKGQRSDPGSSYCTCSSGYYGKGGKSPCRKCPEGYFSSDRSSYCTPCFGYAPCPFHDPKETLVSPPPPPSSNSKPPPSSSSSSSQSNPIEPKAKPKASPEKRKYNYFTHSPSRRPTKPSEITHSPSK